MKKLKQICSWQVPGETVAAFFDVSLDTIERRIKKQTGQTFAEFRKNQAATGQVLAFQRLMQNVDQGNQKAIEYFHEHFNGLAKKKAIDVNVSGDVNHRFTVGAHEKYLASLEDNSDDTKFNNAREIESA